MKILVGILNSRLTTDNEKLFNALYSLYTFKSPGSEYSLAYRNRRWDGKIRFISKEGVFRTGLLERVLEDLEKIDCKPEIVYEKEVPGITPNDWQLKNFVYYLFQEELIKKALLHKRGIVKAPTGSGKTLIMAGLVKALAGRKMILLFNAKQLLTQTYKFLTETCKMDNIGICFGEG